MLTEDSRNYQISVIPSRGKPWEDPPNRDLPYRVLSLVKRWSVSILPHQRRCREALRGREVICADHGLGFLWFPDMLSRIMAIGTSWNHSGGQAEPECVLQRLFAPSEQQATSGRTGGRVEGPSTGQKERPTDRHWMMWEVYW